MKYILIVMLMTLAVFGNLNDSFGQEKEKAVINFFRYPESMMSGGRSLQIRLYINGDEKAVILTGTKLKYKLSTLGEVKIKCVAEFAGGGVGSPFVKVVDLKNGDEINIRISAGTLTGVKGYLMNEEHLDQMSRAEFADEVELEE